MTLTVAVGLTGGIGSGKSTVAAMFAGHGVPVLDLDQIGRRLSETGQPAQNEIVRIFGSRILNDSGEIDRAALGRLAFASAEATQQLNNILHPLIWREADAWLERQTSDFSIIEASVLLESGSAARMQAIVVVLADLQLRRRRVLARGYQGADLFDSIVARQFGDAERLQAADYAIRNDAGLIQLQVEVDAVYRELLGRFRHGGKAPLDSQRRED